MGGLYPGWVSAGGCNERPGAQRRCEHLKESHYEFRPHDPTRLDGGRAVKKGRTSIREKVEGGVAGWKKLMRTSRRLEGSEGGKEKGGLADNSSKGRPFLCHLRKKNPPL